MPVHFDYKGHVGVAPDPAKNFARNIPSRLNVVARIRGMCVADLARVVPPGPELAELTKRIHEVCDDANKLIRTQIVPENLGTTPAQRP